MAETIRCRIVLLGMLLGLRYRLMVARFWLRGTAVANNIGDIILSTWSDITMVGYYRLADSDG